MQEISTKFIDLGMDDGPHSEYGEGMLAKQEKFKKEFDRYNFVYETQHLNLPKGKVENESFLDFSDPKIE